MIRFSRLVLLAAFMLIPFAKGVVALEHARAKEVTLCDGDAVGAAMPSFGEASCKQVMLYEISPFGKMLWAKAYLDLTQEFLDADKPLGLFVSAKAASRVYLNGQLIGTNGVPGQNAAAETTGKMDVVFYVPRERLKLGQNEIILHMSGHHGYVPLTYPVHFVSIGPYDYPPNIALKGYLPSFLPLGVLLAGTLYFGAIAMRRRQDKHLFLLPFAAFFAACQLLAEVSRGLIQYDYPNHDIRLILVMLFAAATGTCLLLHLIDRFVAEKKAWIFAGGFLAMVVLVFFEDTYGGKALLAIQVPAFFGACIAAFAAKKGRKKALGYAIILIFFSAAIEPVLDMFLDVYYFYIVAGLLIFLFIEQVKTAEKEKAELASERARADRLQLVLDESEEAKSPTVIKLGTAGKIEMVPADAVLFCKGAGDYVELFIADKGSLLHSGSLSELEEELPSTFLKVHRSYIVNTHYIKSLERKPTGSGMLLLSSGDEVPVSRRVMPSVRRALA